MIDVSELTRKYGDTTAVDAVSFGIATGEIVGLLGHNGAGKSTIMKMITGFLEPTSGTVTVDGLDIARDRAAIQRKIGYLPENCPNYPEMTVVDYLRYSATLHGMPAAEQDARIATTLQRTSLADRAGQSIATLSRGYRQRVGVAQAILHQPAILILDEPTNGLDPTQIQQMRALIKELAAEATVIISTHILQEVQAVCDRVLIIRDGRKALDSRLDDLQRQQELVVQIDAAADQALPVLRDLPGVAACFAPAATAASGFSYLISVDSSAAPSTTAAAIAQATLQQGWQLYALHPQTRTLESVFAEISCTKENC